MKLSQTTYSVVTALSLLALAGCGSDNDLDVTLPTPPETPDPAPTEPAVEFPVQAGAPNTVVVGDAGSVFTAENGLSLYFFSPDTAGQSECNGAEGDEPGSTQDAESCAGRWPPVLAGEGAAATGNFDLVERTDGTMQWAYNSFPLYTFIGDSAEGDINGEGLGDVWFLARPTPVKTMAADDAMIYVGNQTVWSATSSGQVLDLFREDKDGFALYVFDADGLDQSACYDFGDDCINAWPPLLADAEAKPQGHLDVIEQANGVSQWTFKGKPLYFFIGDTEAGQTAGDGVNEVWQLAQNVPAIQRTFNDVSRLTVTGRAYELLPTGENNALTVTLSDKDQFTLYTFDVDTDGVSNCAGECVENWPPYIAMENDAEVGGFTKIMRDDGNMQWAYNNQPLYFFIGDTEKGDATGDGLGDVWHIISPPVDPIDAVTTSLTITDGDLGESAVANGEVIALMQNDTGAFVPMLMDKTGFQLYTFDVDSNLQSACTSENCLQNWPPLLASVNDVASAPYSIFEREDGHSQWALNGQPLYFFAGDTQAGDTNGEAVGDVWWVARSAPVRALALESNGTIFIGNGLVLPSQGKTTEELTGLSLYTFANDTAGSGESTCFGGCAVNWPPLYATSADEAFGEFAIIERTEEDGSNTLQWTYKGLPLYFFIADVAMGDTNGESAVWPLARP